MKRLLGLLCWLALAPAAAQPLTVAAAASLADAMREIGLRFEATHPGRRVRFNFAASGVLVQQIVQGAPVDVFASADAQTMERGIAAQVIDAGTRRDFAANALVMVTPADGTLALSALKDLASPAVRRIAIGKPASVPAGRYAQQAITAAGLWPVLQQRVVYADNVRQVLDYVSRGEVDAGFVYRSDALLLQGRVRPVLTVGGHAPVRYPVAVVADSKQPAAARAFLDFLFAPVAQSILARHGFDKP